MSVNGAPSLWLWLAHTTSINFEPVRAHTTSINFEVIRLSLFIESISYLTVFFSYNKSMNNIYNHNFPDKQAYFHFLPGQYSMLFFYISEFALSQSLLF